MITANLHFSLNISALPEGLSAYIERYGYNLSDEVIYQAGAAGGQINTNPLRAGRSWYLSLTFNY